MVRLPILVLAFVFIPMTLFAQVVTEADPATDATESTADDSPSGTTDLALKQSKIAEKYKRIEELILRMAEFESANNPKRAALLRDAYKQSRDNLTTTQMQSIVRLLNQDQLKRAVDEQADVQVQLAKILELLITEDDGDRLKTEKARYREYIRDVERLLRQQRAIQGQNEGGADPERIAKEQGRISDETRDLAEKIKANEEGGQANSESGENSENNGGENSGNQSDNNDGNSDEENPSDESDPNDPGDDGNPDENLKES